MKKLLSLFALFLASAMAFLTFLICSILFNLNIIYCVISFILFGINYVVLFVSFCNYIKTRKINLSTYNFFKFEKEENAIIKCSELENGYKLTYKNQRIEFLTNTDFFEKNMLLSYIVRNVRFKEISNAKKFGLLFKKRLKLEYFKPINLYVYINDKKYCLVKNSISIKNGFCLNSCWYWKQTIPSRQVPNLWNEIVIIDEELFENSSWRPTSKIKTK